MNPSVGDALDLLPESSRSLSTSTKSLALSALEANKRLQHTLTARAEKLEAELLELDSLLAAATVEESQDEPESEVAIPGAKKAGGLFPASEFLNPASPFYHEAERRTNYIANTNPHPLKPKDLEILANAVRQENERLSAYARILPTSSNFGQSSSIDLDRNTEGLDWKRIAEKVSDASSVKRNATECQIAWIADKHPTVNHSEWSSDEIDKLNSLISEHTREKKAINWVNIAEKLGTHRVPIDCMRHSLPRNRHAWSPETDEKLIQAVAVCGVDNWQLVARTVSEYASAGQCQTRWQKSLCPTIRRGAWTEEEDDRLRKAVAGYGVSWMQVATAIPGRTNDQCRERWTQHTTAATGKIVWTDEEDAALLAGVQELGNMWKAISVRLGGNKTGHSCRVRYDKLIGKTRKTANKLGQAGPSTSASPAPGAMTPGTSVLDFSIPNPGQPIGETSNPSRKRAKGKGKGTSQPEAAEIAQADGHAGSAATDVRATAADTNQASATNGLTGPAPTTDEATQTAPPKSKPKPRPKPRPRTAKQTTTTAEAQVGNPTPTQTPPVAERNSPTETNAPAQGLEKLAESPREQPVISSSAKRGRKRKVPAAEDMDQQHDDIGTPKPTRKKARKESDVPAKRSEPVASASIEGSSMEVVVEGDVPDVGEEAPVGPQDGPGPDLDVAPSERMDVDGQEQTQEQPSDTTPKARKRGRVSEKADQAASQSQPARRSARLRK